MKVSQKIIGFLLVAIVAASPLEAQNNVKENDDVLFTVAGQPVTKSEFLYVYQKNNPNKKNDFSKASLQEYLDLYINFKLKVTEARAEQIDTTQKVREELQKYGDQLIKSNFDKEVLDKDVAQHYERMKTDRLVYHILVAVDQNAKPEDSITARNKIMAARDRVMKGEDMDKVAKEISSDPNAKENGARLGWATAFTIPDMTFENMVYNTKPGAFSPVFRTKYGYHFIKVAQEKPEAGQVRVAHLLIKTNTNATQQDIDKAKAKADSIYNVIKSGKATFEDMVRKYSDDKTTASKDGALDWFGVGRMIFPFEETAFSLKNPGDISMPVKTSYGFHIIKLLETKPVGNFDDVKADIKSRIERSQEYKNLKSDFVERAKKTYSFKEYPENKNELITTLDSTFIKNEWNMKKAQGLNKPLFTIGSQTFTQNDMASYIALNQRSFRDSDAKIKFEKLYIQAMESYLTEYDLSQRNQDFSRLMREYRDGIPLFALLEDKVWSAAAKDTIGLEKYYNEHKSNYMWDERVDATIYKSADDETSKEVRKLITKNTPDSIIIQKFTIDSVEKVTVEHNLFSAGQNSNVDKMNKKVGVGENILSSDGTVMFVKVNSIVAPANKTLKEARGYVISNYQDYLEQKWIEELKKKYPVKVNEKVFNSMVK